MNLRTISLLAVCATALLVLLPLAAAEGDEVFEFSGVFPVTSANGDLTWSMQKVDDKYADPEMKIVIIPSAGTRAALEADEAGAKTLEAGECPDVSDGESMSPAASGSCFMLKVDDSKATTTFTIATGAIEDLAGLSIFTAHVPTEFENDRHYLYDASNVDIEPAWTLGKTNAMFTCTKITSANSDGSSTAQIWSVKQQSACNHDCSECDIEGEHTTNRGSNGLMNEVCMEEEHCENGECEDEYILFRCKDEEDGVHVDMHVYEGTVNNVAVSDCGQDGFEDESEYVEYESGVCAADGHGHHTHGEDGATTRTDETQFNAGNAFVAPGALALAAPVVALLMYTTQ